MDRHTRVAALEWRLGLSAHRAVHLVRQAPHKVDPQHKPINLSALYSPDFARRVALDFHEKLDHHLGDSDHGSPVNGRGIHKLRTLKSCIRKVAETHGGAPQRRPGLRHRG